MLFCPARACVSGIANGGCHIFLCPSAHASDHVGGPPATRAPHHGVAEGGRVGGVPAEHVAKLASVVARGSKPFQKRQSEVRRDARPCVSPCVWF